jgi:hypothetical protein
MTPTHNFETVAEAVAIAVGIERIRAIQVYLLAIREPISVGVRSGRVCPIDAIFVTIG